MKKLFLIFNLIFLNACIPAPAETVKSYCTYEWIKDVGVSADGQRRIQLMYQIDSMGMVCTVCGMKVLSNGSWCYATGGIEDGWVYVEWLGEKFYF